MGGGSWSSKTYASAADTRRATGKVDFGYDADVKSGRAKGIHPDLDPQKVAGPSSPFAGKNIRESRDSDEHPESLAVGAFFDVTGSMGRIPMVLQQKLASLMDVVIDKAGVRHPQIIVGAIGDANCDQYPFQVGQFESDNRFDDQLRNIILEGLGGGQDMESYALAYWFAAYHTATDAWEKRGKKSYLFTTGDEAPWPTIPKQQILDIFGIPVEADIKIEDVLSKARERWEIFHLRALDGSSAYRNDESIGNRWRKLLGERVIPVEDSSLICETIAGIINMIEAAKTPDVVVSDLGLTGAAANHLKGALASVASIHATSRTAIGRASSPKILGAGR